MGNGRADNSQQKLSWRQRRQADTLEFGVRMRNQLALELGRDEVVVEDEPVLVWRGSGLGKKAADASNAEQGIVVLTNQRLRFATQADARATDVVLADIDLVHDEDGSLTLRWEDPNGRHAVTLSFSSERRPIVKQLRRSILDNDRPVNKGRATPTLSPQQRLMKAVKRD